MGRASRAKDRPTAERATRDHGRMTMDAESGSPEWQADCLRWRGRVLTGRFGHWCADYDELPVDETCPEWPCDCRIEGKPRA
jgi:hypothetical protein